MADAVSDFYLVVLGKTGSGKSATCNALIGSNKFAVHRGMTGSTDTVQHETLYRGRNKLHIIDTPDVFNSPLDEDTAIEDFRKWETLVTGGHVAFLLTVRLDVRFTPNDYNIYKRYQSLLPTKLRNNIILAFTRVDELEGDVLDQVQLSKVSDLLNDAQGRHVTIAKSRGSASDAEQNVEKIMKWIKEMPHKADGPIRRSRSLTDVTCSIEKTGRSGSTPDLRNFGPPAHGFLEGLRSIVEAVTGFFGGLLRIFRQ